MAVIRNGPRGSTRPGIGLTLSEPLRAAADLAALPLFRARLRDVPRGDGHPVLVLPGFGTGDGATVLLRRYLGRIGYRCEGWELGRNLGHRVLGDDGGLLRQRFETLYRATGRPVSLIGWSLGGVMARRLARDNPGRVRQLIMLGSPFTGDPAAITIRRLFERISGEKLATPSGLRAFWRGRPPTGVPTCAIFTRADGITAWQNCIEPPGPLIENIEVAGSHCGLIANPRVFLAVARRLALSETALRPAG